MDELERDLWMGEMLDDGLVKYALPTLQSRYFGVTDQGSFEAYLQETYGEGHEFEVYLRHDRWCIKTKVMMTNDDLEEMVRVLWARKKAAKAQSPQEDSGESETANHGGKMDVGHW